jgi:hypothetical protein
LRREQGLIVVLTRPGDNRHKLTPGGLTWSLLALVAVLAATAPPAGGATVSARTGRHLESGGGHHCKCRMCRGEGSCCCSAGKARKTQGHSEARSPNRPVPSPASSSKNNGPCVSPAPCGGGDGLPTSAPGSNAWKAIALGAIEAAGLDREGRPTACPAGTLHAAILASRLDDPPEGLTFA